jgi:hypothetical protein
MLTHFYVPEVEYVGICQLFTVPAFNTFYFFNRPTIRTRIFWFPNPEMPPDNYLCSSYLLPNFPEFSLISLQQYPVLPTEAFPIAHELSHVILHEEGYPAVGDTSRDPLHVTIAALISSLFSDLVIDRRLRQYGFDLPYDPQQQLLDVIQAIGGKALPKNSRMYARWVLKSLDLVIYHQMVTESSTLPPIYHWIAEQHPSIRRDLDGLLDRVNRIGYDTPEQQERLLRSIIKQFDLQKCGIYVRTEKLRQKQLAKQILKPESDDPYGDRYILLSWEQGIDYPPQAVAMTKLENAS